MKWKKVLLLGSGPIQVGQAGEFDYAGAQALKALKEKGFKSLLYNPNLASVQTQWADKLIAQPLDLMGLASVLAAEKPDALLYSFGGQTALNLTLEASEQGLLAGFQVLGPPLAAVKITESRIAFQQHCLQLNLPHPKHYTFENADVLQTCLNTLPFPLLLRSNYSLGGAAAQVFDSAADLKICLPTLPFPLFLEEYLGGWKEIEFEIMRDQAGQMLAVCALENLDPMGIHTGDSYVVAPPQTLDQASYFQLREAAFALVESLNMIGECNVQFALHPQDLTYRVIELNARLSRSSALASKATGYPIAYIATRLALGETLEQISHPLTPSLSCFFEPALDYIVVKAPRWDFGKFPGTSRSLGPEMKSTGEVMGIGRDFLQAFDKAWQMVKPEESLDVWADVALEEALAHPTDLRMAALLEACKRNWNGADMSQWTGIAPWFIQQLQAYTLTPPPLAPACLRQMDGVAGEFPAQTPYLYFSPALPGVHDEYDFEGNWLLLPGSGPYGIGASVEFDFTCVSAVLALQACGYRVAMLNANPETVSTDYDLADALIFEPLTPETLHVLVEKIQPVGLLFSFSGQRPHNLLPQLPPDWPFWGTPPTQIQRAENRLTFAKALADLALPQPPWVACSELDTALAFGAAVGYPLIYRPGFVLGGQGMFLIRDGAELAARFIPNTRAVLNLFLAQAQEFELDGIAFQGQLLDFAFSENLEPGGVHSGDSCHLFPTIHLTQDLKQAALSMAQTLCQAFEICGVFNLQFLAHNHKPLIIEANLRASRNLPFLAQVSGVNLVREYLFYRCGKVPLPRVPQEILPQTLTQVGLRVPVFSGARFPGAKQGGIDMQATGEVGYLGRSWPEVQQMFKRHSRLYRAEQRAKFPDLDHFF